MNVGDLCVVVAERLVERRGGLDRFTIPRGTPLLIVDLSPAAAIAYVLHPSGDIVWFYTDSGIAVVREGE